MKPNDMRIKDLAKEKRDMEETISAAIYKFTNDTGLIVEDLKLDSYARRTLDGSVIQHNVEVQAIVRL